MKSTISKHNDFIIKQFYSKKEYDNELYIYQKKLSFTPRLLEILPGKKIKLSRIKGQTIGSLSHFSPLGIGSILSHFHMLETRNGKTLTHMDTNPKNYILSCSKYYMIDFSEIESNYPEYDLVSFLLFYASIKDSSTFPGFFKEFLDGYESKHLLSRQRLVQIMPESMVKFDQRRKKYNKSDPAGTSRKCIKMNRQFLIENILTITGS